MKNKNIIFSVVMFILIVVVLLIKFLPNMLNNNNYNDLELYKNNQIVNITKEEKEEIINYLKNEKFTKDDSISFVDDKVYSIKYGNVELNFNNNGQCFYNNNHTLENYNTKLSDQLLNYVINKFN